jgi:hypothetical protein
MGKMTLPATSTGGCVASEKGNKHSDHYTFRFTVTLELKEHNSPTNSSSELTLNSYFS